MAEDIAALAGKKLGPLPAGIWVAAIGGGLAFSYWRSRKGTTSTGATRGDEPSTTTGQPLSLIYTGTGAGAGGSTGTVTSPTGAITNNEEWYQRAASALLAKNYDPTAIDNALRGYLNGQMPTISQNALIAQAIILVGAPPNMLPPVTSNPPPILSGDVEYMVGDLTPETYAVYTGPGGIIQRNYISPTSDLGKQVIAGQVPVRKVPQAELDAIPKFPGSR